MLVHHIWDFFLLTNERGDLFAYASIRKTQLPPAAVAWPKRADRISLLVGTILLLDGVVHFQSCNVLVLSTWAPMPRRTDLSFLTRVANAHFASSDLTLTEDLIISAFLSRLYSADSIARSFERHHSTSVQRIICSCFVRIGRNPKGLSHPSAHLSTAMFGEERGVKCETGSVGQYSKSRFGLVKKPPTPRPTQTLRSLWTLSLAFAYGNKTTSLSVAYVW